MTFMLLLQNMIFNIEIYTTFKKIYLAGFNRHQTQN